MELTTVGLFVGVVPNIEGRVLSSTEQGSSSTEAGLYVVGWLRRGPSGVIGTNLIDAEETVRIVLQGEFYTQAPFQLLMVVVDLLLIILISSFDYYYLFLRDKEG